MLLGIEVVVVYYHTGVVEVDLRAGVVEVDLRTGAEVVDFRTGAVVVNFHTGGVVVDLRTGGVMNFRTDVVHHVEVGDQEDWSRKERIQAQKELASIHPQTPLA